MEPSNQPALATHDDSNGAAADTAAAVPASFHELALRVVFAVWQDLHVKGSGLVFFFMLGYGAVHPADKEVCQHLAELAGTYLFGASLNRK